MELTQKEKDEVKVLLDESKKSRNTWGTIFFITLALFIIEVFTKTIFKGEIGLTIGGFSIMAGSFIFWMWARSKKRVSRYESLLSKVIKD